MLVNIVTLCNKLCTKNGKWLIFQSLNLKNTITKELDFRTKETNAKFINHQTEWNVDNEGL
jgi:hypothetical protein